MASTDIDLQPGETPIDTWTLFYSPPDGGKYNGKLTVTNRRLLYRATDDASFAKSELYQLVAERNRQKPIVYAFSG